jgi:hypothetical protein
MPTNLVGTDYRDPFGGYTNAQAAADAAFRESPTGQLLSTFGGQTFANSLGGRNPNPFFRGVNAATAYESRKQGKRIFAPAMGALSAQNALLTPTLDLAGRTAAGYGDIWRTEAGKAQAGYAEQNPELAALMHLLTADASSLVGGGNSPIADRDTVQAIRAAQAARGLGYSGGDALAEILGLDRAREGRRMQRGAYGSSIVGLGENYYQNALATLLKGGPVGGLAAPQVGTGTDDLLSVGINDTIGRRNMHQARVAGSQALIGSGIQAIGSIVGGFAAHCWVAEELYGRDDVRTRLARAWVASHDTPFTRSYRRHGRAWAAWLKAHPWAKPIVQPLWDAMWRAQLGTTNPEPGT